MSETGNVGDSVPRVDVCVISCRRPRALQRLLGGLRALRLPADCDLRVVVVDNDPGESAREICGVAERWLRWPLLYCVEKRRGIPQARNAALTQSLGTADFVAFIDDDEVPDPDWLAELLATQAAHGADAVTGPVDPVFEAAPPGWLLDSGLFAAASRRTGTPLETAYTNNVLVSSRAISGLAATAARAFDERMALCGSSDSEFFERFAASGHRIVWCESARVREWIPTSRANLRWLMQRGFRVGATRSLIERLHPQPSRGALRGAAHGSWCLAKGALLALWPGVAGRSAWGLYLACAGAGRLAGLLGFSYQEYRRIHGG